jgi:hypothetical protein
VGFFSDAESMEEEEFQEFVEATAPLQTRVSAVLPGRCQRI